SRFALGWVWCSGTWNVLKRNADEIARRAGRRIEVVAIAVRDLEKARALVGDEVTLTTDGMDVVRNPEIDIVVELVGGDTLAREWVMEAIAQGKHVVTANKALLAKHGNKIFAAAHERSVMVAFEAAVAGGIPIIKAIREGLTANRIQWLAGIINGTTNYILSEMRNRGVSFAEALADAQRLGYAEADPTFDIEGVDAAHKLSLLASLAFGIPVQFSKAHVKALPAWHWKTCNTHNAWATTSSCWVLPAPVRKVSNCAYTPHWFHCKACWPMSKVP
ncbi:homoserine dehydrogenase, partial [Alcaligenes sp. HPC1271]